MHKLYAAFLLAFYVFFVNFLCSTAYPQPSLEDVNVANALPGGYGVADDDDAYYKRFERYVYGLGRRDYTYSNNTKGGKRIPMYNFGLGKRAVPYSFGLGKREVLDDTGALYDDMLDNYRSSYNQELMDEKRNRPYSFGLGKRRSAPEDSGRRNYPNRYGFGLGR